MRIVMLLGVSVSLASCGGHWTLYDHSPQSDEERQKSDIRWQPVEGDPIAPPQPAPLSRASRAEPGWTGQGEGGVIQF
jgi:hypothetical protein